jgi:hypothetical protein
MDFIAACQRFERAQAGCLVMAGLDPAIYVFASKERKQDMDHRDKPGDDAAIRSCSITGALEYWITAFAGDDKKKSIANWVR